MAATGYSPIQLYYSTTASTVPTAGNLASGELAINITDGKLYYKDNAGAVQLLSTSTTATGTANGVLYLNGSKVATSGSALTFDGTNMGVGGVSSGVRLDVYGSITARSGTVTADAYTNYGTNLTLNSGGSLPILFQLNGSEAMRLTSTGLGIGTSSPGVKLDVVGQGRVIYNTSATNTGDQSAVVVGATTSGAYASSYGAGLQFQVTNNSGGYAGGRIVSRLGADNNTANLVFQARNYGWTDSMTLDNSGNLGIGTSSPGYKVDASGQIRALEGGTGSGNGGLIGSTSAQNGNAGVLFQTNNASRWNITTSGTNGANLRVYNYALGSTIATFDSSGNLGLGVTPSAWGNGRVALDVKSNGAVYSGTNMVGLSGNAYDDGSWKRKAAAGATLYEASSQHAWYITGSSTAGSTISWTQAMTLDADGDLGIGTTSPVGLGSSIATIDIANTNGGGIRFRTSGAGNSAYLLANSSGVDLFTGDAVYMRFGTSGTERARIDSSGNLLVGTTSAGTGAIVDVQSTTKGVRFPNMTTTQKNAITPAAGTVIFDTTLAKLCVYSGSAWQTITSV